LGFANNHVLVKVEIIGEIDRPKHESAGLDQKTPIASRCGTAFAAEAAWACGLVTTVL
jgi:membrane carboxypeptidase/penicillin-binding protein PbpC